MPAIFSSLVNRCLAIVTPFFWFDEPKKRQAESELVPLADLVFEKFLRFCMLDEPRSRIHFLEKYQAGERLFQRNFESHLGHKNLGRRDQWTAYKGARVFPVYGLLSTSAL